MSKKQLNIDLIFNANTTQAKSQMKSLQTELSLIQNTLNSSIATQGLTTELSKANNVVTSLRANLSTAFNVNTGKLDLNKFSTQLSQSGLKLKDIRTTLQTIGPEGDKAFRQLTSSIVQGQMPLQKTNGLLNQMMNTFANTLKWQIASSAIHGVASAFSEAFQYAEDLNESLTNIRVVTGLSTDQMAKFAEKANKAAKALSTATTAYTDAALIYYQQGLQGEEVEKRAETTLKLANVVGESAETVSEWMTAIWNNFDDGSKSLEYYADVMAKLGAETASSADEIAQGFEKFAAVADTVGLSYEYGAAALAAVTSQTRQSADVVGTAFKTLFARIQDLNLGKTLDDGTSLGKYSGALAQVGINIKDTSGELKEMDDILDEMGQTWDTLSQDQQVALAKSVAGIRQYTQLIALMDNYDYFKNLTKSAKDSTGTLQEQQDIWAESWEGAKKRVQAAAEGLYNDLIDDKFFIDLNNTFADLLSSLDKLFEAMGGLKTLIPFIGGALLSAFGPIALNAIGNFWKEMHGPGKEAQAMATNLRKDALKQTQALGDDTDIQANMMAGESAKRQYETVSKIEGIKRKLNTQELETIKYLVEEQELREENLLKLAEEVDKQRELAEQAEVTVKEAEGYTEITKTEMSHTRSDLASQITDSEKLKSFTSAADQYEIDVSNAYKGQEKIDSLSYESAIDSQGHFNTKKAQGVLTNIRKDSNIFENLGSSQQQLLEDFNIAPTEAKYRAIIEELKKVDIATQGAEKATKKFHETLKSKGIDTKGTEKYTESVKKVEKAIKVETKAQKEYNKVNEEAKKLTRDLEKENTNVAKSQEKVLEGIEETSKVPLKQTIMGTVGAMGMMAGGLSSLYNGVSSLTQMFKTGEHTLGGWLSAISSIGMSLGMVIGGYNQLTNALSATTLAQKLANSETSLGLVLSGKKNIQDKMAAAISLIKGANIKQEANETREDTVAKVANMLAEKGIVKGKAATAIASLALTKVKAIETGGVWANTIAWLANPIIWIPAVIMLAIAAIVALIAVIISWNKSLSEQNKLSVENASKNLDLIDTNQELAKSVAEVTEEYKSLKDSGESTYETLKKLKEQMPELIESYKNLQKELGVDLSVEELEATYEGFEAGLKSIEDVINAQEKVDTEIKQEETKQAERGLEGSRGLMETALREGQGRKTNDGKYYRNLGGHGDESKENLILQEELKNFTTSEGGGNDTAVEFDLSDPTSIIEYYERLQSAKSRIMSELTTEERANSGTFEELEEELAKLGEYYDEAKKFSNAYFQNASETFDVNYGEKIFNNFSLNSLRDYEANREKIIDKILQADANLTREQAELMLSQSEYFKSFEKAFDYFDEDGFLTSQINQNAQLALSQVKSWYDEIPEEDKTLFVNLDWTTIGSKSEMEEELEKAREKLKRAQVAADAEAAGIDISSFEMYSQVLAKNNAYLDENSSLTDQIALDNLKLNKGLQSLQDGWEDNYNILKAQNKLTPEYAEALGQVHDALEKAFGVSVSANFIEQKLETIKKLAEGDVSVLQELQDEMALDYIVNMDIQDVSISKDATAVAISEGRKALEDMIKSIDTSLEIGKGTTLSGDFLNTIQQMIDAGQITETQLKELMRAKGYELNITGWKEVDGPTRTLTRTIKGKNWLGFPSEQTETVTETEKIQVPIINGEGNAISGSAAPASVTKAVTNQSVDFSSTTEGKNADRSEKDYKQLKDEIDRYHEINEVIDDIANNLDRLSEAKEHAFGKDKIKLMQEELAYLDADIEAQKELIRQNEAYLALDKKNLSKYNVKFDEDGRITNYDEMITAQVNKYNNAVTSYNNGKLSEEAFEDAEKDYERFQEYLEQYEESLNSYQENTNELAVKEAAKLQAQLETIDYAVTIKVEVNEKELKRLQKFFDRLESDLYDSAEKINNLGEQTQKNLDNIEYYRKGIDTILTNAGASEAQIQAFKDGNGEVLADLNLKQEEIDKLNEYAEGAEESVDNLKEIAETVNEVVITSFESWYEVIGRTYDKLDDMKNLIEGFQNIIEIIGVDILGITDEIQNGLIEASTKASIGQVETRREQVKFAEDALEKRRKELIEQGITDEIKMMEDEEFRTLNENVIEANQNLISSTEEAMQAIADQFDYTINKAAETFEDAITGSTHKTLDELSKAIDKARSVNERYLADYEKIYNLTKMSREVQKSIDSSSSLRTQKKLRDFQAEIAAYQAEGVEMSQYELDHMQKRYDIMVAEIALEEARDAKNQVRLQRDQSGSWNYVYTANEDLVNDTAQKYDDALYNYMNFQEESITQWESKLIDSQKNMVSELAEIRREDYASEEEYLLAKKAVLDQYEEEWKFILEQMGITLENNKNFYDGDYTAYDATVKDLIGSNDTWKTKFEDTVLSQQTGFTNLETYYNTFKTAVGDGKTSGYLYEMNQAWKTFEANLADVILKSGYTLNGGGEGESAQDIFKSFGTWLAESLFGKGGSAANIKGGMLGDIKSLVSGISVIGETASKEFAAVKDAVKDYDTKFKKPVDNATKAVDDLTAALIALEKFETDPIDISVSLDTTEAENKIKTLKAQLEALSNQEIDIPELNPDPGKTSGEDPGETSGEDPVDERPDAKYKNTQRVGTSKVITDSEGNSIDMTGGGIIQSSEYNEDKKQWEYMVLNNATKVTSKIAEKDLTTDYTKPKYDPSKTLYINEELALKGKNSVTAYPMKGGLPNASSSVQIKMGGGRSVSMGRTIVRDNKVYYIFKVNGGDYAVSEDQLTDTEGPHWLVGANVNITSDDFYSNNNGVPKLTGLISTPIVRAAYGNIEVLDIYHDKNEGYLYKLNTFIGNIWVKQDGLEVGTGGKHNYAGFTDAEYNLFDTGGYTGSWGPEGKLAVLHQKELILNAADTENILTAVSLVREIGNQLERNAMVLRNQFAAGAHQMMLTSTVGNDTLQQDVTIHAEFPNVTDHNEIEYALRNLINDTSQYINRK